MGIADTAAHEPKEAAGQRASGGGENGRGWDRALTLKVKSFAYGPLGADLAGIANIERFAKAPPRMSPQGILPTARSVVVMAVHHPDAAIELGGEEHPQKIGPYRIQYLMNLRMDEMSYRLGLFLERAGYPTVPLFSSNVWRYRPYKDQKESFAPDLSHRHAAVAAGLAEFGYSALAITPEFGARQRFISVITTAPLEPDPLLEPGSVCDQCRLCVRHCPSMALSKELGGMAAVEIEDKTYTFVEKNLWRCSWGEHFDLDLDLPIPEKVTEEVLREMYVRHGKRAGEMGCCLKYCLPKARRYFDRAYSKTPRRQRPGPKEEAGWDRGAEERIRAAVAGYGLDFIETVSGAEAMEAGSPLKSSLPEAECAIVLGYHYRAPEGEDQAGEARRLAVQSAAYDLARALERAGYAALSESGWPEEQAVRFMTGIAPGRKVHTATVLTSAPWPTTSRRLSFSPYPPARPWDLRRRGDELLRSLGADLMGVVPAEALNQLKPSLARLYGGQEILVARDKSSFCHPYDPEIRRVERRVKGPEDHLPSARSVWLLGVRLPAATIERTGRPPAEAVGPMVFAQVVSIRLLRYMGFRLMRLLEDHGYRAALTFDLSGTASTTRNLWWEHADLFGNRIEAAACGLGRLGRAGFLLTPQFGPNIRFAAVVTDAEVAADDPKPQGDAVPECQGCDRCLRACPAAAFGREAELETPASLERFHLIDPLRCDWSKRYCLSGQEGPQYLGWDLQLPVPERIDEETLAAGLRQHPPVLRRFPCGFEACALACPRARPIE